MKFNVVLDDKTVVTFDNGKIVGDAGTKAQIIGGLRAYEKLNKLLGENYEPNTPYYEDPLAVHLFCEKEISGVVFTGDVPDYPEMEEGFIS